MLNYNNPSLDFTEIPNLVVSNLLLPNLDETIIDNNNGICDKLCNWILHFKITHNVVNSYLTIIRRKGMKVPKDVRTLCCTLLITLKKLSIYQMALIYI